MGERRNAASLLTHSLKTPLSSVKVAAQLLQKHLQRALNEKDAQLLDALIRNASTLEIRINKMLELATPWQDRVFVELELEHLEMIHSLKAEAVELSHPEAESRPTMPETGDTRPRIIVHADPEIADLIPKFLDNRKKDIDSILQALAQNDFDTIRLLGHSMKGAGGGFGFDGVSEIGKHLEQAAMQTDAEGVRQGLRELSQYLSCVEVIYDEQ